MWFGSGGTSKNGGYSTMTTLFTLPFMLPTLYTLQMMSLCGPLLGPSSPAVRDSYWSDLE
jgi:hypothetical protein